MMLILCLQHMFVLKSRMAWKLLKSLSLRLNGAASSADLGGSSKYSNENFED